MRAGTRSARTAAAAVAGLALTGCQGGISPQACVSWVTFETPVDAARDADLVVQGRLDGPVGSVELFGAPAALHEVQDGFTVLAGPGEDDLERPLEVASTPVTCTAGGTYPDGDPLETDEPVILLLHRDGEGGEAVWRTITPLQGVLPAAEDGSLPDAWPAATG